MPPQKKSATPDDKITQLLAKVEAQKAAIAEAERPVLEKLQDLEARLDKIISPERRRELELQAIERELSK